MAHIATGIKLAYDSVPAAGSDPATFTDIAGIEDITPGKLKMSVATVKHHGSANAEKLPGGIWETEDVPLKLVYAKTQHATLLSLKGIVHQWKITYTDTSTDIFTGFINEIGNSTPLEKEQITEVNLVVSGVPTFAPAA